MARPLRVAPTGGAAWGQDTAAGCAQLRDANRRRGRATPTRSAGVRPGRRLADTRTHAAIAPRYAWSPARRRPVIRPARGSASHLSWLALQHRRAGGARARLAALKLAHRRWCRCCSPCSSHCCSHPPSTCSLRRRIPRESSRPWWSWLRSWRSSRACLGATWHPARDLLETAPDDDSRQLEAKVRPLTRFIAKVQSVSTQAEQHDCARDGATQQRPPPWPSSPRASSRARRNGSITLVSMTVPDILPARRGPGELCPCRSAAGSPWGRAGSVFERVRADLARYFSAVTFSNMVLGVGDGDRHGLLDMPNPLLWGVIAFTLQLRSLRRLGDDPLAAHDRGARLIRRRRQRPSTLPGSILY